MYNQTNFINFNTTNMGDRPRFDREGEDAVSETPQDEVSQDQVAVPHALLEWEDDEVHSGHA